MQKNKIICLSIFTALCLQIQALAEETKNSESLGTVEIVSSSSGDEKDTYTVHSMSTSTKLDLSLRETPQSVSVITAQKLEDLGVSYYQDLLTKIPGVTLNRWDERVNASARGFDLDYYKIDGMPTYSTYNARDIDLAVYDRIEVVRGANGLTTGYGNPAMSINLVRKRADSEEFTGNVGVEVGSWNSYRMTADVGSALNESGSIRGRAVIKHEQSESYMDGFELENNLFYGVIDADITDTTYLSTGVSYQKLNKNGIRWGGLPAFDSNDNRVDFSRSKTVSDDWTYWNNEIKSAFIDLQQMLYKDISLNVNYAFDEINNESALLYFAGKVNMADGSGLTYMDWQSEDQKQQHNFDTNIKIPYELGGLSQEFVFGASYNLDKTTKYNGRYPWDGVSTPSAWYTTLPNFFDYNTVLPAPAATDALYVIQPEQIEQKALYLVNKFTLLNDLKLIAGARLSSWEYTSDDTSIESRKFDNQVTPYVGLVYDLDDNHSVYTSFTSIFQPQDEKDSSGSYLDPIEGNAYEAGVKGEYFNGNLTTSLSIFRIEQDNVASDDPSGVFVPGTTTIASIPTEGVVSKGFEFDVSGKITERFTVDFGIANFKAEDATGNKYNTKASRTTANVFAKYKLNDLTLGGGLNYKSKFFTGSGASYIEQKGYILANAMAKYDIDKSTTLQLNVNNLFDKKYYEGIGANSMVYGTPRNATLSLKYTF